MAGQCATLLLSSRKKNMTRILHTAIPCYGDFPKAPIEELYKHSFSSLMRANGIYGNDALWGLSHVIFDLNYNWENSTQTLKRMRIIFIQKYFCLLLTTYFIRSSKIVRTNFVLTIWWYHQNVRKAGDPDQSKYQNHKYLFPLFLARKKRMLFMYIHPALR